MSKIKHVVVVDADVRRRATLSFSLARCGIHAEPLETIEEMRRSAQSSQAILAYDSGNQVATLGRQMITWDRPLPIVAYYIDPTPSRIVAAVRNGAVDYLTWPCNADDLVTALDQLEASDQSLIPATAFKWADKSGSTLTPREREVLAAAAEGLPNKEIARKLSISSRTVEVHRSRALHKIGAKNIAEAIGSVFGLRFSA